MQHRGAVQPTTIQSFPAAIKISEPETASTGTRDARNTGRQAVHYPAEDFPNRIRIPVRNPSQTE